MTRLRTHNRRALRAEQVAAWNRAAQHLERSLATNPFPIVYVDINKALAPVPSWPKEGDLCACGLGRFTYIREGDCSCHISPPCSSCVDAPLRCDACGDYGDCG